MRNLERAPADAPAAAEAEPQQKAWEFRAAQFTYNSKEGAWSSHDPDVLKRLFDRMVAFWQALVTTLGILGLSVTLEESLEEGEHVHAHVYYHSGKVFKKRGQGALDVFAFEGIRPHVQPNTARGGAASGATRHGHFYVVVDKLGTLHNWTNYFPFKHYAVEAWWLDNLLKAEKIDREVYLTYAARVGIGFQRRLGDIRAAQRFEKASRRKAKSRLENNTSACRELTIRLFMERGLL